MNQDTAMPLKKSRKQDMSIGLPGIHLRQARESRRLTQQEVALQLRLSLQVIDAIEHDDYKTLPGQIFVRGYLRAYARLVFLSEDDIIQAFNNLDIAQDKPQPLAPAYASAYAYDETATNHASSKASIKASSGGLLRWFFYLVILLVVIMVLQWWVSENPSNNLTTQFKALLSSIWPSTVRTG
jgi:cytoskeleton protein RodZ